MAESGEVAAEAVGQASARGSACSKAWRAAELLDMVARHRDDGGRDYGGGATAVASAMVQESEGEELGRKGCVCELGGGVGDRSKAATQRGEEEGRRAATSRAQVPPSSTCLPAWPSQAARWSGGWAGPAGGPLGGAR